MSIDFDLVAYLTGKGHRVRKASGSEVFTNCFFCGEHKRQGKLYLNTESWLYDCKVCGESGNRRTLLRHFGDEDNVAYTAGTDPYLRRVLLEEAATLAHEMLLGNESKLQYLLGRGLGPETIVAARLGYVPRNFSLARSLPTFVDGIAKIADLIHAGLLTPGGTEFLSDSLTIPYISHGHVVSIREKKQDGKYRTAGGESVRLYNEDALRAASEVIITEGEYDALILQQVLAEAQDPRMRTIAVVAVPGAQAWPADLEDRFEAMRHVFIGLDPDVTGREGAAKMKALLGTRARVLELPREMPKCDWCADEETEVLTRRGWLRFDEVEPGDEAWSIDPETREASWGLVADVYRKHRRRTMVRLSAQTHDSLTTPDHRWLTQRGFVTTKDLRPSDRIPLTAPSMLPVQAKYDDDLVALVAWYYTEGHVRSAGISVAQKEPCAQEIRDLLTRMYGPAFTGSYSPRGVPTWRERTRDWGVVEFDLNGAAAMPVLDVAPNKTPSPEFLSSLTRTQVETFVDVSIRADGWVRGKARFFCQVDEGRIDAFVMACSLAGLATRVSERNPGGHGARRQYVVTVLQRDETRVASLRRAEVEYDGVVWCPSVPGRGTWYARRGGKTYFTGNTEFLRDRTPENPHGGHGWQDVRTLVVEADLAGKRMFTVGDAAAKWERNRGDQPGIKLGWATLDSILRPGLKPGQIAIPLAKTGCIQGDAEVVVNRGGKSFRITMRDLVHRINGGIPPMGPRKPWDPRIETYVQRAEGGTVRLGKIKYAWASGVKTTWEVTTETGRKVRATDEHPFLTEAGWSRLDGIEVGTRVAVNAGRSSAGRGSKPHYFYRSGLVGHPYANRRNVKAGGTSVPFHRLVAEAQLNGIPVDDLLARCRDGNVVGLTFLDPAVYAVHHCDHDPHNNDPANLKVLTHAEHAALHAAEGTSNVLERVQYERVVSVRLHGEEETYDIEVEDDPHNYIANGFVVHNTGKTVFLSNVVHNCRSHRTLMLSLELTAAEVYEQLHRIHFYWNPTCSREQMLTDYDRLRIVDQNRLTRGDLATLVHEYAEELGAPPELLIVDYLGYYARGFKGGASAYERLSDAVMELKAVAKEHNLAIIAPHQVNRTAEDGKPLDADDARDSGVIEETGDFVLGLFRPSQVKNPDGTLVEDVTGAFNVQLLKSRHGGKGRVFNLRFSNMSLVIVDAVDRKNAIRVEQENAEARRGIHYEDWRTQQSTTQLRVV